MDKIYAMFKYISDLLCQFCAWLSYINPFSDDETDESVEHSEITDEDAEEFEGE